MRGQPWRVTRKAAPPRACSEGARAVRQAFAARRQAVLFVARHLAEGAVVAVGQEHRVVAEALRRRAAARPACRRRAPRTPRHGRRARRRTAPRRNARARCSGVIAPRSRSSRSTRCIAAGNPCPVRPSAPSRCRARRRAHRPRGRNRRRTPAARAACAAACALMRAFAAKVVPVSSGSGRPSSPAETASTPYGASSSRISPSLPGLCVAITSLPVICGGCVMRRSHHRQLLQVDQLADALAGERQQREQLLLGERRPSRRCPAPRRCRRRRS